MPDNATIATSAASTEAMLNGIFLPTTKENDTPVVTVLPHRARQRPASTGRSHHWAATETAEV